jgi:hypothetical protein
MPQDKTVLSAYEMFLEKGITGAVAVLAIAALIWAVVKLLKAKDDRIQDQKLFVETLLKSNEGLKALTIETNKVASSAASEASVNSASLKQAMDAMGREQSALQGVVTQLRDEHIRLTAAIMISNMKSPRAR